MHRNRGRNEKIDQGWPKKAVCARKSGHKPRFLARGGQKMRWCPKTGAGTKNLSTSICSNWRCGTAAFFLHSSSQSGGKRNESIGNSCTGDTCSGIPNGEERISWPQLENNAFVSGYLS
ncbi:MAG: hypothetical protein QM296_01100 [Bacillota bacterium]|nr:hypothetical protein [Bacillota bacterium]